MGTRLISDEEQAIKFLHLVADTKKRIIELTYEIEKVRISDNDKSYKDSRIRCLRHNKYWLNRYLVGYKRRVKYYKKLLKLNNTRQIEADGY